MGVAVLLISIQCKLGKLDAFISSLKLKLGIELALDAALININKIKMSRCQSGVFMLKKSMVLCGIYQVFNKAKLSSSTCLWSSMDQRRFALLKVLGEFITLAVIFVCYTF